MNDDTLDAAPKEEPALPKLRELKDSRDAEWFLHDNAQKLRLVLVHGYYKSEKTAQLVVNMFSILMSKYADDPVAVAIAYVEDYPMALHDFKTTESMEVVAFPPKKRESKHFNMKSLPSLPEYIEETKPKGAFSGQGRSLEPPPNPMGFWESLQKKPAQSPPQKPTPAPQPKADAPPKQQAAASPAPVPAPVAQDNQVTPQSGGAEQGIEDGELKKLRDELLELEYTNEEIDRAFRAGKRTLNDCSDFIENMRDNEPDAMPEPAPARQPVFSQPVQPPAPPVQQPAPPVQPPAPPVQQPAPEIKIPLTPQQTKLLDEWGDVFGTEQLRLALELSGTDDEELILQWLERYQDGKINVEQEKQLRMSLLADEQKRIASQHASMEEEDRRRTLEAERIKKEQMDQLLEKKRIQDAIKRQRGLQSPAEPRPLHRAHTSPTEVQSPSTDTITAAFQIGSTRVRHEFQPGTTYRDVIAKLKEKDVPPDSEISLLLAPSTLITEDKLDTPVPGGRQLYKVTINS